jgi:magnesium chelatase subunit D
VSPFEAPFAPDDRQPAGAAYADAVWAAAMLAVDPAGLGGMAIRAWSGPLRDSFLKNFCDLVPAGAPVKKMPLHISDDRMLGGIDLTATLQGGRPVQARGLLAEAADGVLIVSMAERLAAGSAARLTAAMDDGGGFAVVAMDEGGEADEAPPAGLLERLAFLIPAAALPEEAADWPSELAVETARMNFVSIAVPESAVAEICTLAVMLGIGTMRAPVFALRAARAAAALQGHDEVTADDIAIATRLVLAPRATQMPATAAPEERPEDGGQDEAPPEPGEGDGQEDTSEALEDMVAEAAKTVLPPALLAAIAAGLGPRRMARGAGKGGTSISMKRGRPAGTKRGTLGGEARLSLLDTLRAAAPWQAIRQRANGQKIQVRAEDFRIKKFKEQARTVAIFAVDASGSSAVNRLAEAKGAVQLLLAECYVRRDQVALLAFRGRTAECLLPPTAALARAKRCLASLPGGGPTPLATGIAAACAMAAAERRKGHKPLLVLLTDGGANIGRDGKPGRAAAGADAAKAAQACRAENFASLVVDTAPRPNAFVAALAREMGGQYLPLPYADPARLSRAVRMAG